MRIITESGTTGQIAIADYKEICPKTSKLGLWFEPKPFTNASDAGDKLRCLAIPIRNPAISPDSPDPSIVAKSLAEFDVRYNQSLKGRRNKAIAQISLDTQGWTKIGGWTK